MQKCFNYTRKNLKRKGRNQGITLIALVITVIVLLILAGTAITLSINGGNLFSKTNEAANEWNTAVAKEENALSNVLEILDMAANPDLAKYKLTVKVNYDENGNKTTVESPYYVWYPSAKYIDESNDENCKGIKCRVLYNDTTYGLQLISVNPITTVTLGKKDPKIIGEMEDIERAQKSYNRAITTLNEKAEEYITTEDGSVLATDARCVGSDPLNKNNPDNLTGDEREAEMFVADSNYTFMKDYNGKYFKTTMRSDVDVGRMWGIRIHEITDTTNGSYYWVASRGVGLNDSNCTFSIRMCNANGIVVGGTLWAINSSGDNTTYNRKFGIRPIFIIASGVKVTGGAGTEESPFELGL